MSKREVPWFMAMKCILQQMKRGEQQAATEYVENNHEIIKTINFEKKPLRYGNKKNRFDTTILKEM